MLLIGATIGLAIVGGAYVSTMDETFWYPFHQKCNICLTTYLRSVALPLFGKKGKNFDGFCIVSDFQYYIYDVIFYQNV